MSFLSLPEAHYDFNTEKLHGVQFEMISFFFLPRKAACLFHLVFNYYYYYSLYYCYFISEKDKLSTFMKAMLLGIGCGGKKRR